MSRLLGKVAIVTGAANGIGKAAVTMLAKQGAAVCAVDLPNTNLGKTVTEIEGAGGTAFSYEADVSKSVEVESFVAATEEKYGGVDILFNNAGVEGTSAPLEQYPLSTFDKVIDINMKGPFYGTRHVSSSMRKRGGGSIINMSSMAGLRGFPGASAYNTSKAGLLGVTLNAAMELGPANIRVNAICAGFIETRMAHAFNEHLGKEVWDAFLKEMVDKKIPLQRIGEVDDVANLVTFLASDESSYITGSVIRIDGGYGTG